MSNLIASAEIDETHAAQLESWVESANAPDTDFPIHNLPLGQFRLGAGEERRLRVAIRFSTCRRPVHPNTQTWVA